jgi:nucleotide-binding universal stress UspA family protein
MKLLIGYDGSQFADEALDDLARAGLPAAGQAEVLAVADVLLPPAHEGAAAVDLPAGLAKAIAKAHEAVEEAQAIADRGADRLRDVLPGWSVAARGIADSPAWAIIKRADEWPADLILVGAQGHGFWQRMMGSISSMVVAEAHCSVRVARSVEARSAGEARSSDSEAVNIIVAVDGSDHASRAVDTVAGRDWPQGSTAHVVAVVDAKLDGALAAGVDAARRWAEEIGLELDGGDAWVRHMADRSAEKLRQHGLEAHAVVREGNPKQLLIDEAEQRDADVIFMGARGLSRVERVLLGGMSRVVVARAPCTVEIVR